MVKRLRHRPFTAVTRVRFPLESSDHRSVPKGLRTFSSVGESNRLITGRSWVRVPEGPLAFVLFNMAWWLSWLERRPVTAEVVGSNPIRVVCPQGYILIRIWDLSSAGRASALQAEGHRFEPYRFHMPQWRNWQTPGT